VVRLQDNASVLVQAYSCRLHQQQPNQPHSDATLHGFNLLPLPLPLPLLLLQVHQPCWSA
jgi:hypothetical protein